MLFPLRHLLVAFCAFGTGALAAEPIRLEPVEATTAADARFAEAVDGVETADNGWMVPQSTPQSGVFRCVPPMAAGRVRFSLVFGSGQKDSCFGEFSISVTTDRNPSLAGHWQLVFPTSFSANQGWLDRAYPHLHFVDHPGKTTARVGGILPDDGVTGIRVEVWPSPMGPASNAILTELRMERMPFGTTNIALGCPVTASHALPEKQYAESLTDGLIGSYAHPANSRLGRDFYFEIDLRRTRDLDHISLRGRAQSGTGGQFTHLHLQLFDEEPESDAGPVWEGKVRETAPEAEPGTAAVVRSADGQGTFRGRYLRIFSTSVAPYSPQIAEVEVYESLVPSGVQVRSNDRLVTGLPAVRIPAGANWLAFTLEEPPLRDGMTLGKRLRIVGGPDGWIAPNWHGAVETRGLPPGEYLIEAQLRHSDFEWNSASLRIPLIVLAPWWKNPWAQLTVALAAVASAALLAWHIARRRVAWQLAELERSQELSQERRRIARDMHDVVGARLTQLTVMHELFAAQETLSWKTRERLEELTTTARDAVGALDEAVWAINPRNDTLQNIADYLCHAASSYLSPLDIRLRQHAPEAWPEREVGAQKRHQLLLAFKEALQNIVKHAGANLVTLTLRFEDPVMVICLDDNGCGLPPDAAGPEKDGLENMRTRLAAVGGSCVAQTRAEGGTRVEFRLPV
ncbi:histidine kinase [Chthoniobacter flavus Ellin428]|uniref:Histidine kinase n=1 Tax=Chthoniobacter flavus Ellin428 TaxID=497964 RepID=B4CYB4_9BACT|nr:histidine kinase [Chthoniobacter flavus]EDY20455.1 histidine kinase [Chthoniobacter flavus Ellin428]TCO85601.1 histidine kinase [Chthoniobacter flavus]